jgi:regulatory protein
MKIISIERKDERTRIIHLDNNEILFLSNEVFIKNGLRKNDEISEVLFNSLIRENKLFYLKQKAFKLLGRRLHSEKELRTKLNQKGYEKDLIDVVIEELHSKNYLNDYEFAKQFAEENIKNKLWGQIKIESELVKKGVKREIISEVLKDKFFDGNSLESAVILVNKKLKTFLGKKIDDKKLKLKLLSFLISRGYDYETSRRAVEHFIIEND